MESSLNKAIEFHYSVEKMNSSDGKSKIIERFKKLGDATGHDNLKCYIRRIMSKLPPLDDSESFDNARELFESIPPEHRVYVYDYFGDS